MSADGFAAVPQVRPKRVDLVYAAPRPAESMAIVVIETDRGYRYVAVSELWSHTGITAAPNAEIAVLDAIDAVCALRGGCGRFRFVSNLPTRSRLWQCKGPLSSLAEDWWIDRPDHADQPLIDAANAFIAPSAPPPVDQGRLIVATDGSVRRGYFGIGWLSATGDYGIDGYRTRPDRVGTDPVVVAELCAIGSVVCALPRHHLTVLSDSQSAVAMVRRWKRGECRMPAGYPAEASGRKWCLHAVRQRIYNDRHRIDVRWARGHCGEPLNEGADALARLGSRYRQGGCELSEDEYQRRAAGISRAFAAEYRRVNAVGSVQCWASNGALPECEPNLSVPGAILNGSDKSVESTRSRS